MSDTRRYISNTRIDRKAFCRKAVRSFPEKLRVGGGWEGRGGGVVVLARGKGARCFSSRTRDSIDRSGQTIRVTSPIGRLNCADEINFPSRAAFRDIAVRLAREPHRRGPNKSFVIISSRSSLVPFQRRGLFKKKNCVEQQKFQATRAENEKKHACPCT